MPWGLLAAYRGDAPRFVQELGVTGMSPRPATRQPAPLAALAPMIAEATRQSDGFALATPRPKAEGAV